MSLLWYLVRDDWNLFELNRGDWFTQWPVTDNLEPRPVYFDLGGPFRLRRAIESVRDHGAPIAIDRAHAFWITYRIWEWALGQRHRVFLVNDAGGAFDELYAGGSVRKGSRWPQDYQGRRYVGKGNYW